MRNDTTHFLWQEFLPDELAEPSVRTDLLDLVRRAGSSRLHSEVLDALRDALAGVLATAAKAVRP